MTPREYADYIQDILDSIDQIEEFIGELTFESPIPALLFQQAWSG